MGQEILHLSIQTMSEGVLFLREFSYATTQEVFTRTSMMREDEEDCGWETKGWRRLNGPDGNPLCVSIESLEALALKASEKGWTVEWNPQFAPYSKEFSVEVKF